MVRQRAESDKENLPNVGKVAIQGQLGEVLVEATVLQLGQLYERRTGLDFGVDGVVDITTPGVNKRATGRLVGVQVKRGLSIVKKTRYGFTYYCTESHANYWLHYSLPVIVVHGDPITNRLRWQHVNAETLRRTSRGYAIDLPEASELSTSLNALRILADACRLPANLDTRTLILPCSLKHGIRTSKSELGLAALEFSRAALRGETCLLKVEVEEEPDIIKLIDGIKDVSNPTVEERRDAIMCEDTLHSIRKQANTMQRGLTLLLTHNSMVEMFGYDDQLIAEAIRRFAAPGQCRGEPGTIGLDAWPRYDMERPTVRFDVTDDILDKY